MFIKKYLILLLTICITFICIQDSQSQSGRRLWGSDAYIEGDFQSNNIYAEDNISSTTGTFGDVSAATANAQTLNVTGNATVNGFNYIASPTLNGASSTESTSTSVVGGIWNGDFSEGEGSSVYVITTQQQYNDDIMPFTSYIGGNGGLGTVSVANKCAIVDVTQSDNDSYVGVYSYFNLTAGTLYRMSFKAKIESVSPTGQSYNTFYIKNSAHTSLAEIGLVPRTDWTAYSTTFTGNSVNNYFLFYFYANTIKFYVDDIKLEQVTTHTNNSTTPTVAYPVITGVSSEFVDQQQTTTSSYNSFGGKSLDSNQYRIRQTFIASQSKLSAITYKKYATTGSPVGNIIMEIRSAAEAIIASVDIEKALWDSYATNTDISTPIFALLTPGETYSVDWRSDAVESTLTNTLYNIYYNSVGGYSSGSSYYSIDSGSTWNVNSGDMYFKTHYAENTRQITLTNSSTGTSTTVDWGDDGLPDGAVVDLYNGTMSWKSTRPTTYSSLNKLFNSLISADNQVSAYPATYNRMYNGWSYNLSAGGIYGYGTSYGTKNLIFSFPATYIKNATFDIFHYSGGGAGLACDYSFDNSSWTSAFSKPSTYGGSGQHTTFFIDCNSNNNIFLRINGAGSVPILYSIEFTATLDTSKLAPLILSSGSNTINQSVNGGSYKANVAIKSVSGGFQTTLNEANKQLTILRNAPRSYLETPDKTQVVASTTNDATTYFNGQVSIGSYNPLADLHVEGNIYALGDISAATFTDRTPAPPEDSLSQILKVSSKNGEIDHDTLGAAKVKRVQKISYVNVYSATDNSIIAKIPTTLNENIINITEEVPEQIISALEAIELVTEEVPVFYDLEVTEVVKEITAPHSTVIKPEKIIKYKEKHYIKDMENPLAVDDQYLEEDIYIDDVGDINFVVFPDAPAVETKDVVKKVTRTITLPSGEEIVETTTQEVIQLKPNVVQENDVYKIPSYTKVIGQRNLIKEKIEQEYNIPQEEIILQEQEVIEEVGNRDIGMSVSMSIRSIQQLYNLIENLTNRIKILEENNK